jgi:hypothetical protein
MRSVKDRLAFAYRAAVVVILVALAIVGTVYFFDIRLAKVKWPRVANGLAVALTIAVLLGAWCRNRWLPMLTALVLTAAVAAGCAYADNVLLVILLAVGLGCSGYLVTHVIGFLLPFDG